ncbi:2,3-diaminopropionate biosynthesis protein SbnA [Nonomuraea sp. B12E4]|uniref:2,3-diaminopropionate biosynthesis protein SbnA n=1 Tax=Nonomuraea sp. B12E4 TaxID=3153564 RepID=UPI00325EFF51
MTRVIAAPHEFNVDDLYLDLAGILGRRLYLKCEGFNFAGSIKMKAALGMIDQAERDGLITPGMTLVESSSGNMGVALSMVASSRGYRFVCVTDSRCTLANRRLMEVFGAQVVVITHADEVGGLLGARLRQVRGLCSANEGFVWLNQYANQANWTAHHASTAPEIARAFPALDVLFVGAGTTGTLMGCARYFREHHPEVTIVAVDAIGSVTFGGAPAARVIPGVGTGVRPPLLDVTYVDDVVHVSEEDTVRACHRLAERGFLLGGSTGTVVAGAAAWLEDNARDGDPTAVAISPDLGERYLDTIYYDKWLEDVYGPDVLAGALAGK